MLMLAFAALSKLLQDCLYFQPNPKQNFNDSLVHAEYSRDDEAGGAERHAAQL